MVINIVRNESRVCLELQGALNAATAPALKKAAQELLAEGTQIWLDLEKMSDISEEGIQCLEQLTRLPGGCRVRTVNAGAQLRQRLEKAGLKAFLAVS